AADVTRDHAATRLAPVASDEAAGTLELELAPLLARADADLAGEGIPRGRRRFARRVDVRYRGQSHELTVELPDGPRDRDTVDRAGAFHELHERRYGFADRARPVERVALRVHAVGLVDAPPPLTAPREAGDARVGDRGGVPVYVRARIQPGARLAGPAIVVEY